MPRYTFTVRKRGCEISLITDDKNAVEQQIAIWVLAASRKKQPEKLNTELSSEQFAPKTSKETFENNLYEQSVFLDNNILPEAGGVSLQKNSQEQQAEFSVNTTKDSLQQETADKVEQFVNTLDKTEVLPSTEVNTHELDNSVTINNLFNAESPAKFDFEAILEHSADTINNDTVVKKDEIFCKLVKANNITDRLELLLFTADYFCKYDARFTFSLKQINGKLMHNLAVIVDHGILKIALDNNYIERAGDSEYRLTEYGRSEIYSKAGIWS